MTISNAIRKKISKICKEQNITVNKLATISGITQSTLDNIMSGDSKNPKILTIVRICDGLDIKLYDFFQDDLFKNIDRED